MLSVTLYGLTVVLLRFLSIGLIKIKSLSIESKIVFYCKVDTYPPIAIFILKTANRRKKKLKYSYLNLEYI